MMDGSLENTEEVINRWKYGDEMLELFEQVGSMSYLDSAVDAYQKAVQLSASPGHPHRAKCLNNLGNALRTRFEQNGSLHDLNITQRYPRRCPVRDGKHRANRQSEQSLYRVPTFVSTDR
jgi:hypothetical protein